MGLTLMSSLWRRRAGGDALGVTPYVHSPFLPFFGLGNCDPAREPELGLRVGSIGRRRGRIARQEARGSQRQEYSRGESQGEEKGERGY